MMAAEINESTPVEAPAIPEPEAVPKISDDSNNGGSNPPSVNGTATSGSPDELSNKHIADIVDDLVNSAEPSISGGSDTETSRLGALKNKDGDKGHVRTSSTARKPTTFKSVSVNKTFLAAKAAGSPGVSKPGDTSSPTLGVASLTSALSAPSRPRLVAKTGLVKGVGANGRPAAAPDPNAVWNKNRPVPVPEPRKLTDEELKKYGIHISTRLQQDDAKGQANWADIDDDDEDWAPEEIRWTDGTKSTIPHHDEAIQPSPQPHSLQPDMTQSQLQSFAAAPQPSPTAPMSLLSRDGGVGEKPKSPAPTAVKIGGLPSGRGLILKGAQEKPTLVAKPPAPPTPVKSPWASLPPVDKAAPVPTDLPPTIGSARLPYQQPQFHQYPQRDMYGGPPRGSTPPPFKEIAADDFSRSGFRDGHSHMNRELFNSQSGRLEPVPDRRGSTRGDIQQYRQPPSALLQRQSQSLDQQPEPSAAFQTHRSSAQEGPYGRRRNSSNVSGGSGSFLQRLGRPHDQHIPPELLNAQQPSLAGRSDSPVSPRNYSPSDTRSWQTRGSPAATFAAPYSTAPPNALPGALPNAATNAIPNAAQPIAQPPLQGAPQAAPASIEDELEIQKKIMRERRELAKKRRLEEEEREEAAKRERIRLKLEAMGPAPERKSAKKETSKDEAPASAGTPVTPLQSTAKLSAPGEESTPDGGASSSSGPQHGAGAPDDGATDTDAARAQQQQQQSWQGPAPPQTERIASWGSANQSARNVWGSPNNRSLGNGTFNSDLGPIGPPSTQKSGTAPSIAPIGPPKSAVVLPPPPPAAVQAAANLPVVAASAAGSNSPGSTRSAWASAVKTSDDNLLAQQKALRAEQQREAEARGLALKDLRPTIKDTWIPTRTNEEGNRVEDKSNQSVVHRPGNTVGGSSSPASTIHSQQARPSRFFPARDVRLEESVATAQGSAPSGTSAAGSGNHGRPGSPSPPPPDMDGHPAFDGDASHPHVSLPRPQIVVRLPPKGTAAAAEHAAAAGSHSYQAQSRNTASQSNQGQVQATSKDDASWQARFDNLFDRKVVSPSKPASGAGRADFHARNTVESPTSTHATAHTAQPKATTAKNVKPAPKEPVMTRLMAEDCFERQEMGSLPPVHLPNKVPELAWTPAAVPKPLARRFLLTTATSGDHEAFLKDCFGLPHVISIHFPGMAGNGKAVNLPTPRTNSNSRRLTYGRSGSGRHASSSHRGGGNKARDTASSHSGSHGNDHGPPPSAGHGSSGGRSRGSGMRHRSENWTRGSPAPVQT